MIRRGLLAPFYFKRTPGLLHLDRTTRALVNNYVSRARFSYSGSLRRSQETVLQAKCISIDQLMLTKRFRRLSCSSDRCMRSCPREWWRWDTAFAGRSGQISWRWPEGLDHQGHDGFRAEQSQPASPGRLLTASANRGATLGHM